MRTDPLVLLVDDDLDFRELLGERLRDKGYEVVLASSATQALEIASRRVPAIVLLDLAMPGIDGIQLLRYFRSRHVFRQMPVVIVSAGVGTESVQAALGLGVRDVMLKSKFTVQELGERIELRLSAPVQVVRNPELVQDGRSAKDSQLVPIQAVRGPASDFGPGGEPVPLRPESEVVRPASMKVSTPTTEMIEAIGRLRALPRIVGELLRLASLPDSSVSDLEEVVRRDPVVAARIVQGANSAAYLRGAPVTQLEEALRVLGFVNVSKIASTGAILADGDFDGQVGRDLWALWKHCLAAGSFAERLAPPSEKSAAFLGGLLHDLPSLFALQYLGSDWLPWRAHAQIAGLPLQDALSSALGCPLETISGQILSAYRIPPRVAVPIQEYHEFFLANRPREPGQAARRLDLAHQFAVAAGRPGTEFAQVRCINHDEMKSIPGSGALRLDDSTGLAQHEEESGLGAWEPEIPDLKVSVALWRDVRWFAPDPVESALAQAGNCIRVDRIEEIAVLGRVHLAIVEPGTPEWTRLGAVAPVLALHRGALAGAALPVGVEALRMPVSLSLLLQRLAKMA